MWNKLTILQAVVDDGIVAIIRTESAESALKLCEACKAGGVKTLEVTLTTPGALEVIKTLRNKYDDSQLIVGAGTVLDAESARLAIFSGAQFVVTPALNVDAVRLCNRYQIPTMPGAMSVAEIIAAMECGADIIKLFPGDTFEPGIIKSIRAPLPHAPLMPTGGVSVDNVEAWFKNGSVAVGVGGSLTAPASKGDFDAVTRIAQEFITRIKAARNGR